MSSTVTHRSMVNTWNCDEMGHMNVRHYVAKADCATVHLFNAIGLGPSALGGAGWRLRTCDHHVRFIKELHAGIGLYIQTSILEIAERGIRLCHEIRKSLDDSISATVTCAVELIDSGSGTPADFPTAARERAAALLEPLPAYASPRGLSLHRPTKEPSFGRADELGLLEIFRGTVEACQADSDGYMLPYTFISSISDGVPNLFKQLWGRNDPDPERSNIGAAAVEYRINYFRSCKTGTLLLVRSGIIDIGEKTMRHGHWLFDAETGEAIASAQALAVTFDLVKRRAIATPEEARSLYQALMKPDLDQM